MKTAQDRFLGAIEMLADLGVNYHVIQTTSFSFMEAEQWAKELFAQYPTTDGVIASNDIVAAAILHEAHRLGKAVPGDVQIIGFDDIPLSSLLSPGLSTIHQPAHEMGRKAGELLIQLIEQQEVQEKVIQLPVSFVARGTTRIAHS